MQAPDRREEAPHNNPYNVALWMLYRRWFSDETKRDKEAFEAALLTKLIGLSERNITSDSLDDLWSHTFAFLMKVGRDHLSYQVALKVTQKYYPPLLEWDDRIQSLCQLIHGHCTPEKVDVLARDDYFWEQLHALEKSDAERKMVIHVIDQMIKVTNKGDLSEATQAALLAQPLVLPHNVSHAYAYKFERGIKKLRGENKAVAALWDKKDQAFYREIKQIEANLFLQQD